MIIYGGVMGWLVGGLINDFKNKNDEISTSINFS